MRVAAVAQPLALIMGQHCRVGIEDNIWNSKRERMTTIQQIEAVVSLSERFGRKHPVKRIVSASTSTVSSDVCI